MFVYTTSTSLLPLSRSLHQPPAQPPTRLTAFAHAAAPVMALCHIKERRALTWIMHKKSLFFMVRTRLCSAAATSKSPLSSGVRQTFSWCLCVSAAFGWVRVFVCACTHRQLSSFGARVFNANHHFVVRRAGARNTARTCAQPGRIRLATRARAR